MPWQASDAQKHMKGLTPEQSKKWASIANGALKSCMAEGGKDCEGMAVRIANTKCKGGADMKKESRDISFVMPILEASVVDGEKGIYELTLLREGFTEDKRRFYPRKTLESAVSLFEGAQAFADHPTKSEMKERPERSVRDLVGLYESVHVGDNSGVAVLKANLTTLESAKWIRPLLTMAVENPKLCGASIHADGTIIPRGQGSADLVESIDAVFSTDIVTKPNAGGRIERLIASQRHEGGEDELKIEELTIEDLKEKRGDLFEAITTEATKQAEDKLKAETDKTNQAFVDKKDYDSLKESFEATVIRAKISESKILEAVKEPKDKESVEKDLTEAMKGKTEEQMDAVIEARKVFLKSIGAKVEGNPPKEDQETKGYHVGTILPEAKQAWMNLQEVAN